MKIRYLHTMVRVKDLDASLAFFKLLGLEETRRSDYEQGRFTLIFLAPPGQSECPVELTYNGMATTACPATGATLATSPMGWRISMTCARICRPMA
ncbi:MAG: hypothetical protein RLZZ413_1387 [Pseudomonadota bacterium]